ncbi:MAG: 2-dehydropantoate 2-reductase N-terminal domain-containing protein [Anaeromyxobacteraceae bacterium]
MRAVVIGPGRIGCGFAGHLLAESGYEVTFVGRGAIVDDLERAGEYRVRLVNGPRATETVIRGVHGKKLDDPCVAQLIAEADVVAVSVGTAGLTGVAKLLADGLARRATPGNVLAFENAPEAGVFLQRAVEAHLPAAEHGRHGFSGALVSRIVTRREGGAGAPLVFVGDPPAGFVVHGPSLRGPLPVIAGMQVVEDYRAWVQKKLFTFSAGHATTAYLGALKGYRYVHAAIRDLEIRARVLAAMEEGRRGLEAQYGPELAGTPQDLVAIVQRFENAALNDPIERVGRDPKRKLGCDDRIVGAALLAERAGVRPLRLALAAAAALCFECPGDASACALQRDVAEQGAGEVLGTVAGLDPAMGLGRMVTQEWKRLSAGRAPDAKMLSLDRRMWSWRADAEAPALATLPPLRNEA